MRDFSTIEVTHANNATKMLLVKEKICGAYYSIQHRATFIVSDGQTIFPAKESLEEVENLLNPKVAVKVNVTEPL